jgi:hypothetical protein
MMKLTEIVLADGTPLAALSIGQKLFRDNKSNDRPDVIGLCAWRIISEAIGEGKYALNMTLGPEYVQPSSLYTKEADARKAVADRLEQKAIEARRAAIDAMARTPT